MNTQELIGAAKHLCASVKITPTPFGVHAQICDFLRDATSAESAFYKAALEADPKKLSSDFVRARLISVLDGFINHVETGLLAGRSPRREGQLDVVADLLDQARVLLEDNNFHSGAAAFLIGATLEEFLRTWVDHEGLLLGDRKPTMQSYVTLLREKELITKQDVKDLTAWAGIRNSAAHGEWDQVEDRRTIRLMLEGVNLFMRKYSL